MNVEKSETEEAKVKKKKFYSSFKCTTRQGTLTLALTCLTTLSLITFWIIYFETRMIPNCESSTKTFTTNTSLPRSMSTYSSYCVCNVGGNITCVGIPNLETLENNLYDLADCDAPKLVIHSSQLTTIPTSFLETSPRSFTKLDMISNSRIVNIEDNAFSSETFRGLQELTFEHSIITQLRKQSFYGIDNLRIFQYRMAGNTAVNFEENFFQYMSRIEVLQFNYVVLTAEDFRKTTAGDVHFNALQNVDLGSNDIETLDEGVFKRLDQVVLFHLHRSKVRTIHVNAFQGMNKVQTIYLNDNSLQTLPEGVFGSHLPALGAVFLSGNYWICDCNLQWLKDLALTSNKIPGGENLVCQNHGFATFSEVDFCPTMTTPTTTEAITTTTETTTTTTETTTTTVTSTQTETSEIETSANILTTKGDTDLSRGNRKISCIDWTASSISITRSGSSDLIFTQNINVREEQFTFHFYDPDEDPVRLIVEIIGNLTNFHLLFFDSFNTTNMGCVTRMDNAIELTELQRSNTYTFCMIYGDEATVAPMDCFGFEVRMAYGERVWIPNRLSRLITALFILILILAIILGALLTYICIRKHPALIKGNKRVIIINKKKPEVPMTPKEYEKPVYTPPSIDSMLSSATQSQYGYTKIKRKQYNSPMLRNVNERAVLNNEVSYIRPTGPTSYELNTWRVNSRIGQPRFDTFEESIYHQSFPPPLPPPNGIRYLPRDDNLYTTL